ncbi:MAG: hypothetical protein WC683_03960 [bacterium]
MGLRELYESEGEVVFTRKLINLIVEGKLKPEEFSLRALWEAMGRPRLSPSTGGLFRGKIENDAELKEAVDSTMFPKITGTMINKVVMDAYQLEYGIGDRLVRVIPSTQKDDTIVGMTAEGELFEVGEGLSYEETGFEEKHHKIYNRKFGRIVGLTEEAVKFDQTGQMIARAQLIGEKMKAKREQVIMEAVLEKTSSGVLAAWRPGGTSTALYSDTSTDPYSATTFDNNITDVLSDETDIDAAFVAWASAKDENGEFIQVVPDAILTNLGKASTAMKLFQQDRTLASSSLGDNIYKGKYQPYTSPWVNSIVSATAWFIGAFRKQFIYTEVFAPEVTQARPGSDQEWLRDVIYQWKARFMGGCGAVTNRYVIKSTGAG